MSAFQFDRASSASSVSDRYVFTGLIESMCWFCGTIDISDYQGSCVLDTASMLHEENRQILACLQTRALFSSHKNRTCQSSRKAHLLWNFSTNQIDCSILFVQIANPVFLDFSIYCDHKWIDINTSFFWGKIGATHASCWHSVKSRHGCLDRSWWTKLTTCFTSWRKMMATTMFIPGFPLLFYFIFHRSRLVCLYLYLIGNKLSN